jgi:hypothetical protein
LDTHKEDSIHSDDFGRKILMKIFLPKCEQGVWSMRSNPKLQNAYKSPDIVTEIRIRKLELLGHVFTTEDTGRSEMTLNTKPEGRRGVGRPKLGRLGDVEANTETLHIKRWRLKAQDTKEWMVILREDKTTLKGPQSQRNNNNNMCISPFVSITA